MNLGINGQTALILGASSGLGLAVARSLAAEGATVGLLARNTDKLKTAVDQIASEGGSAEAFAADLRDRQSMNNTIADVRGRIGPPSIIVTNCGGPQPMLASTFDPDAWHAELDAMVLSSHAIVSAFLPDMQKARYGRIIVIASVSVVEPMPSMVLSNALRAAQANWAKTLAREVASFGITVNTVMPGKFETDRTVALNERYARDTAQDIQSVRQSSISEIPALRYGEPHEFAAAATFLASTQAGYITGTAIPVDGGLTRG